MIWRARSARAAMLAIFVALFGFFMFAPRMHERYLYYPLVFLIPIALESEFLTSIFAVVSATFLFNLIYIKHLTDTSSYFPDHPNAGADRGGIDQPRRVLRGDGLWVAAHSGGT